jgi:hypothetical protein
MKNIKCEYAKYTGYQERVYISRESAEYAGYKV